MFPLTLSPFLSTPSSCLLMLPPVCMPPLTRWAWVSVKGTGMYDYVDTINSCSSPFPFFSSLATSLVFLAFCPPIHLTFSRYVLVGPCRLLHFLYTFLLDGKWSLSGVLWASYPWGCSSPSLKTPRFPHCPATKRVMPGTVGPPLHSPSAVVDISTGWSWWALPVICPYWGLLCIRYRARC